MANRQSRITDSVRDLFRRKEFRPNKSLGQNFLVDSNFLDAVVRDSEVGPKDEVIEIGAGPGNLTERLADRARHVTAFEIDPALAEIAQERLEGIKNVTLILADGAEFASRAWPSRCRVVSNLPYRDYQRILLKLLAAPIDIISYTLMLQKDVYDRLRAKPGMREYGPLAVLVQGTCAVRMLRSVGRRMFYPSPRVESVLFRLERKRTVDVARAHPALRQMFAGRRKKFGRKLKELGVDDPEFLRLAERRVDEIPAETLLSLALR